MGYRVPSDEEVLGAVTRVIAREGSVTSQRELRESVLDELHLLDKEYRVSGERIRKLAVRSRYVELKITLGVSSRDPPSRCPVCDDDFEKVKNKTLDDQVVTIGWSCVRCPYWTGEDRRVPLRYGFHGKRGETPREGKLS